MLPLCVGWPSCQGSGFEYFFMVHHNVANETTCSPFQHNISSGFFVLVLPKNRESTGH